MIKNRFVKNIFSLGFIQSANFLFPFITIPYVVRIIGPEKVGIVNLAQTVVAYLIMLVNYGFDFTATRDISINRHDRKKLNELFNSTIIAKILLFILSLVIFIALLQIDNYKHNSDVFWYTYIAVLANVLFPTWYFQGIEQITKVAVVYFFSRFFTMVFTLVFVRTMSDYPLVPLVASVGQLFLNASAFVYVLIKEKMRVFIPKFAMVWKSLVDGWPIFLSAVVINIYMTGCVVILGFYSPGESVGYFTSSTKIISLVNSILMYPIYQTLFPHLSKSFNENKESGFAALRKMFVVVFIVNLAASIAIFTLAEPIVLIIYGRKFIPSIASLRILAIIPILTGVSNVLGVHGLVNMKKDGIFLFVSASGAVVSVILNIFLAKQLTYVGTSIAWTITEIIVMVGFVISFRKVNAGFFNYQEFKNIVKNLGQLVK
jgi:O-antigen/teichoic acid export membrane protein